jgi:hypothetical protein
MKKEYEKAVTQKYETRKEAGKNKNNQEAGKKEVRDEKGK